jgi:Ca2+/Na+ antiporter
LKRNGVAEAGVPLNFQWLKAAAAIGISSMIVMIALASRAEILGLALVIAVSLAIYAVIERARRVKKAVETPV